MSYYVGTREDQRQARETLNYKRVGLPANEMRGLDRAQRRSDLEHHFNHSGDASRAYKPSRTVYQDAELSRDQRHKISEIRTATRATLGPSFDPFDETTHTSSRGWTGDVALPHTAIPSQYIKKFNQRWYEDDRRHNAHQCQADQVFNAPWRNHEQMELRDHYKGERSTHQRRPYTAAPVRTTDSPVVQYGKYDRSHLLPTQPSTFKWAESKRRFGFRDLFRRNP